MLELTEIKQISKIIGTISGLQTRALDFPVLCVFHNIIKASLEQVDDDKRKICIKVVG